MKTLSKTGYLAYFGDLKIDLKKEVKKDLKMEPLKCVKFTYLGGGGSPQRGYPGGGHLRSFWGRFGDRFESLLELQNDALEVVLEVLLRSF